MKSAISPYSKMFLVTPSVYQKMLNCISEKEQMVTNALNIPETEVEQSPTEKIVGEIAQSDFGVRAPEAAFQVEQSTPVQTIATENQPADVIFSTPGGVAESGIDKNYTNPLKQPCTQDSSQGQIIPSLFYKPSIKMKKQVATPQIMKPLGISPVESQDERKFKCVICSRAFSRNSDLKRHLRSPRVHTMFNKPPTQIAEIEMPTATPTEQEVKVIENPNEMFQDWSAMTTRSGKKITPMDTSTPTIRGKRTASRAKLGNIAIPPKSRPAGGEGSFDNWV